MRKRFLIVTISILIFAALAFSSCETGLMRYDTKAKNLTATMLNGFASDNMDEAYTAINDQYISYSELISVSNYLDSVLGESDYYKMNQIAWQRADLHYGGKDQHVYSVIYDISASGSSVVTMEIVVLQDGDGICGIDLLDTSYVSNTEKDLKPWDVVLTIYTVLTVAFTLWMFVSCWRRRIAHKRWWALLTLFGVFFRFSILENGIRFFAMLTFILNISGVAGDIVKAAVNVTVGIPVGAIIYFLMRKKIKDIEEPPLPPDYDHRASSEGFSDNSWL